MNFDFLNNLKANLINLDNDIYEDIDEESVQSFDLNNKQSNNYLMKFYAKANTLGYKYNEEIVDLFKLAYEESPLKAIRILFYVRDKKDGLGKRTLFRLILNYLGSINDSIIKGNLNLIAEYGRWDDLYALYGTPLEESAINLFKKQIKKDLDSQNPSTLAKWLKSENTSSIISKKLATRTRELLGLTSKEYRKTLTELRSRIGIVEQRLSSKEWSEIKYGEVPYFAMKKYTKAFSKNDKEGFQEFLNFNKVNTNNRYINKDNLIEKIAPYNIIENMILENKNYDDDTYLELWGELPKYITESLGDSISILGLSGDILNNVQATPAAIASIGTALYIMDNNKGRFKNYIISSNPNNIRKIRSKLLRDKIYEVLELSQTKEVNIESALDIILFAAIKHNLDEENIPKRLFCITDNNCEISILSKKGYINNHFLLNAEKYENIKDKWERAGFSIPKIILWNIDGRREDSTVIYDNENIIFAFGYSRKVFKTLVSGDNSLDTTNLDNLINSPRYTKIKDYWF